MISNTEYIEFRNLIAVPMRLWLDEHYFIKLIDAAKSLHDEIHKNKYLFTKERFDEYVNEIMGIEIEGLERIKNFFYKENTDSLQAHISMRPSIYTPDVIKRRQENIEKENTRFDALINQVKEIRDVDFSNSKHAQKSIENKNVIHWNIDKLIITSILEYLIETKKYIVLPEKLTQNKLYELLIGSEIPKHKISWNNSSVNFGKVFRVLVDAKCFTNTTKAVLAKRLLEIFDVKSSKGNESIKFNTLKEYLSGNSLNNALDFPHIRKIVFKAKGHG